MNFGNASNPPFIVTLILVKLRNIIISEASWKTKLQLLSRGYHLLDRYANKQVLISAHRQTVKFIHRHFKCRYEKITGIVCSD